MPRTRAFTESEVLEAATNVFWTKGFEGTSVQDLVDATGLSRGSLYASFGDKQQLFVKSLRLFEDRSFTWFQSLAAAQPGGVAKIRAVFDSAAESTLNDCRGCLVANAATELSSREPWMAEIGEASRRGLERFFQACLDAAVAIAEIDPAKGSPATARFLTNALLGLRVVAKMKPTRELLDDIVRTTLSVL
jgi:TetR/AcrR family transcriptional repressor of nem operon